MKKGYRFLSVILINLVIGIVLISCVTKTHQMPSSPASASEITTAGIVLYRPQPGEKVQELFVNRTGSLAYDLNNHEEGVWFKEYSSKIVNIYSLSEVQGTSFQGHVVSHKTINRWRIEYVQN